MLIRVFGDVLLMLKVYRHILNRIIRFWMNSGNKKAQ